MTTLLDMSPRAPLPRCCTSQPDTRSHLQTDGRGKAAWQGCADKCLQTHCTSQSGRSAPSTTSLNLFLKASSIIAKILKKYFARSRSTADWEESFAQNHGDSCLLSSGLLGCSGSPTTDERSEGDGAGPTATSTSTVGTRQGADLCAPLAGRHQCAGRVFLWLHLEICLGCNACRPMIVII